MLASLRRRLGSGHCILTNRPALPYFPLHTRPISDVIHVEPVRPLAYDLHEPSRSYPNKKPPNPIIFLHGLFGSKKNNRGISRYEEPNRVKELFISLFNLAIECLLGTWEFLCTLWWAHGCCFLRWTGSGKLIAIGSEKSWGFSPQPASWLLCYGPGCVGVHSGSRPGQRHRYRPLNVRPKLIFWLRMDLTYGCARGAKTAMTLALGWPEMVASLVAVDNAPVSAALNQDFSAYIRGMEIVQAANVTRQADADRILREFEAVGRRFARGPAMSSD